MTASISSPAATERTRARFRSFALSERAAFASGTPVLRLWQQRTSFVDRSLRRLWPSLSGDIWIAALGGYARRELYPHSDVDLAIICDRPLHTNEEEALRGFFRLLWDARLPVRQRIVAAGDLDQALEDVESATALFEARMVVGDHALIDLFRKRLAPPRVWPVDRYFDALVEAQRPRHRRFSDTAFNVEPHIKEGPGGLRDLQVIRWLARRRYGAVRLEALAEVGLLEREELEKLRLARRYMSRLRFALHLEADRNEDRLTFDYQRTLAERLGFSAANANLAVEQMMQEFHQSASDVAAIYELVVQHFSRRSLGRAKYQRAPLDKDFRLVDGLIEAQDPALFENDASALVRIFVAKARCSACTGLTVATTRALRRTLSDLQIPLHDDDASLASFHALLRDLPQPAGALADLQRHGVLAHLVPAFAAATGRMQFDFFHAYTVDQHTIFVISKIGEFADPERCGLFPLVCDLYARLESPDLLYLAALFHDIAKGWGGNHSRLGAEQASAFCTRLGLDKTSVELVRWLVENHLLFSQVAQRRDIEDDAVIAEVAGTIADSRRLVYLYLLTIADISATHPRLWNEWRARSLERLYRKVANALAAQHGSDPIGKLRQAALGFCSHLGPAAHEWLNALPDDYFERFDSERIAAHLAGVFPGARTGLVVAGSVPSKLGAGELVFAGADREGFFASVAHELDQMNLNVVEARLYTVQGGRVYDVMAVLDASGSPPHDIEAIARRLQTRLDDVGQPLQPSPPSINARVRSVMRPAQIRCIGREHDSVLEFECSDRPGLLSGVAYVLWQHQIRIHGARIATFGARAEDSFKISDHDDQPISDAAAERLVASLRPVLDVAVPRQGYG